jgi:hypothetical protein
MKVPYETAHGQLACWWGVSLTSFHNFSTSPHPTFKSNLSFQIKNSFKTEMESVFHIIVAQQPTCTERNAIEQTQRTSRGTSQRNGPKQRNNPNGTEAIDGNNVGSDNTLHREPKRITQLPMEVTIHY